MPGQPILSVAEILSRLRAFYGELPRRPAPDPVSELIRTILSQNTSDANSWRAYHHLRQTFGTWEAVAQAPETEIAQAIHIGGLARVKTPRIKEILKSVQEKAGSLDLSFLADMPLAEAKAWLQALSGVGPKTAACVLLFSLGRPALPVDTHVYRVAWRLGVIDHSLSPEKAHDILEAFVPPEEVYDFHVYFITHGRRTCKAIRPLCSVCPLQDGCPYFLEYMAQASLAP